LILIHFYCKEGDTFSHAYNYAYSPSGNLTTKTNIIGGVPTPVTISYSDNGNGNQALTGTSPGSTTIFTNTHDDNGNRTRKRHYQSGALDYDYRYLYNLDNKMAQVLDMDGNTVVGRVSDQFYHLDGSRMWEGALDVCQVSGYQEGNFAWNQYLGYRFWKKGDTIGIVSPFFLEVAPTSSPPSSSTPSSSSPPSSSSSSSAAGLIFYPATGMSRPRGRCGQQECRPHANPRQECRGHAIHLGTSPIRVISYIPK
jgi:hypothetical protein